MHRLISVALVTVVPLMVAACDGLSEVGEQTQDAPVARAVVVGQSFTPSDPPPNGKISTTVRSGAEVTLSGKESDSDNAPIMRFEWAPDAATSTLVPEEALVIRSNTTVSFTAPAVSELTTLLFTLRVVDANEQTATAQVEVNVEPVPDQDRFLSYTNEPSRFFVYTKLSPGFDPAVGDVTFTMTVEPLLNYTDRSGTSRTDEPIGTPAEQTVTWPISVVGGSSTCEPGNATNPVLAFDLPTLDADEIALKYQDVDRERMLELRDIDSADLKVRVTLTQTGGPSVGLDLCDVRVQEPGEGSGVRGTPPSQPASDGVSRYVVVLTEDLLNHRRGEVVDFDTRASALAYYATIDPDPDPNTNKTRLSRWLELNGFDADAADYGADVHAVYTNNFDLGFGRDMYAKVGSCDAGISVQEAVPGQCDIASVVFNYGSLEGAAKKVGPVLAVAMEYSRADVAKADLTAPRFTKFYAFAPNLEDDYVRVASVNLDGRGEKYLPQSCVVCHGGLPGVVDIGSGKYGTNGDGDISAGWLGWDLNSFLFSDTDPGFSRKDADATLRTTYTRDAQQEEFRKLNFYAYLALHPDGTTERFRRARELITHWYGDEQKLRTAESPWSDPVPASWSPAPEIYSHVFAQNCRACHVLHMANQVPIGTYEDFIDADLSVPLEAGRMPFARLTMDRFWVPTGAQASDDSAAAELNNHLVSINEPGFGNPGTAQVVITGLPQGLETGGQYRLSALGSEFASTPLSWSLEKPQGSNAELAFGETLTPVLTGVDIKGTYVVRLTDSGGAQADPATAGRADVPVEIMGIGPRELQPGGTTDVPLTIGGGDGGLTITVQSSNENLVTATLLENEAEDGSVSRSIRLTAAQNVSPTPAEITVRAWDNDVEGPVPACPAPDSACITFQASVTADLTPQNCEFQVQGPRPNNANNFAMVVLQLNRPACVSSAPGVPLIFELASGPELLGRDGNRGDLTIDPNGNGQYLPPKARMTDYKPDGGSLILGIDSPDTFDFRVSYEADPNNKKGATATIRIVGTENTGSVDFGVLRGALNQGATCDGACHAPGGIRPTWLGKNEKEGYCRMTNGRDSAALPYWSDDIPPGLLPNFQSPYVNRATPQDSALYLKPTGGLNHQGTGAQVGTQALWNTILIWIEQGAYYTEAQNQSCPQPNE